MAAPKFTTPSSREQMMAIVAKMDRRGYSYGQIAEVLGVTPEAVGEHVRRLKREYRAIAIEDLEESIGEKIEQYKEMRREAWEAWERSKERFEEVTETESLPIRIEDTRGKKDKGDKSGRKDRNSPELRTVSKVTKSVYKSGAEYLRIVLTCLEAERKLRGTDAPEKMDLRSEVLNWGELAKAGPVPDVLAEKIERARLGLDIPPPTLPPAPAAEGLPTPADPRE
jgi:predicted transcriptional regulator